MLTTTFWIDELGYLPLEQRGAHLFFQLVTRRYERSSTFVTRPAWCRRPPSNRAGRGQFYCRKGVSSSCRLTTALMPARVPRFFRFLSRDSDGDPESDRELERSRSVTRRDGRPDTGQGTGAAAALAMLSQPSGSPDPRSPTDHIAGRGPAGASARGSRWSTSGCSNGQMCTEIGWRYDLRRSTGGLWTVARSMWLARRIPSFGAPAMSPPTHSPDACAGAPVFRFLSRDSDGDPDSDCFSNGAGA